MQENTKARQDPKTVRPLKACPVTLCPSGIVPSSVVLTSFQVMSRVFLIWAVTHSVKE
ncbi:hypothetical protein STEG23_036946, partial [Scotinomys teguina]